MDWLKNRPWLLALSELQRGKLYFATTSMSNFNSPTPEVQLVHTDKDYVYEGFFLDFGPLHLGQLYRYCHMMRSYQQQNPRVCIVHCTGRYPEKRANAAYLVGAYAMLYLGLTPKEVCKALTEGPDAIPFKPFQDASISGGPHTITLEDCLNGLQKARSLRFFDLDDLDVDELEEKRDMLGGDLSWLVPDRFLAFCGPSAEPNSPYPRPEQYLDYFHENGVTTVVRLNRKNYNARKFTQDGIKHFDVFLADGSTPSKAVLEEFLDIAENEDGAIAVHCKAGLGRTGTLVGAYLIKHYRMTAMEAIAWLRICRPGSVIGNQQAWLQANEKYLTRQGDIYRKQMLGEADLFDLPKFGVYSKRAKVERRNIKSTARKFKNIVRRDQQLFDTSSASSSKEVKRINRPQRGTLRDLVKTSDGEIRGTSPLKYAKTKRYSEESRRDLKRSLPTSLVRRREFDSRRHGYSSGIFGSSTNRSEYLDRRRYLDSGDVANTSMTQGDKLNAVKLAREHGISFPQLPFKQIYGTGNRERLLAYGK